MIDGHDGSADKVESSFFDDLLNRNRPFFAKANRQLSAHLAQMGVRPGDREDLIAEAWLRAVKHRHRFAGDDPERWLRNWLIKVAHRLALDRIRRSASHPCPELDVIKTEPIDAAEVKRAEMAEWREHMSSLLAKVNRGDEMNVRLFQEHFFHGHSAAELARQYGMTAKMADGRIRRLVEKLPTERKPAHRNGSEAIVN